uniref:(northern house mosquito) hypothetical protein n=1 Tax=Culex pipiens TaxID=7175 RepID=A0A8D8K750_CULPI
MASCVAVTCAAWQNPACASDWPRVLVSLETPSSSNSVAEGSTESLRDATLERNMPRLTAKRKQTTATNSSESGLASARAENSKSTGRSGLPLARRTTWHHRRICRENVRF